MDVSNVAGAAAEPDTPAVVAVASPSPSPSLADIATAALDNESALLLSEAPPSPSPLVMTSAAAPATSSPSPSSTSASSLLHLLTSYWSSSSSSSPTTATPAASASSSLQHAYAATKSLFTSPQWRVLRWLGVFSVCVGGCSLAILLSYRWYARRRWYAQLQRMHRLPFHHSIPVTRRLLLATWNEFDVQRVGELTLDEVRACLHQFFHTCRHQRLVAREYARHILLVGSGSAAASGAVAAAPSSSTSTASTPSTITPSAPSAPGLALSPIASSNLSAADLAQAASRDVPALFVDILRAMFDDMSASVDAIFLHIVAHLHQTVSVDEAADANGQPTTSDANHSSSNESSSATATAATASSTSTSAHAIAPRVTFLEFSTLFCMWMEHRIALQLIYRLSRLHQPA